MRRWLWALALVGCGGDKDGTGPDPTPGDTDTDPFVFVEDADGDGFTEDEGDCDDNNFNIYPGAEDVPYDGIDSDCDGADDFDVDQDGYQAGGYGGDDCDDTDPAVNPGAAEIEGDGIDNDCDGCGGPSEVISRWYTDGDGDGHGDPDQFVDQCAQPPDGVLAGDDCDDADPTINPSAYEVCNGIDDDCAGGIDDGLATSLYYPDEDADGFGDEDAEPVDVCNGAEPAGWQPNAEDCNDDDPNTWPGAPAVACDGWDNDCNPATPEGNEQVTLDGVVVADLPTALAAATPGAVIELCEGTYAVNNLAITVPLELTGLGGAEWTRIDGSMSGPLLRVTTPAPVTLSSLTLTGGTGFPSTGTTIGGGLRIDAGGQVTLDGVDVEGNLAGTGAGIHADDGARVTLIGSDVRDNVGDDSVTPVSTAAGIHLGSAATLTLEDSDVRDNVAGDCAGVHVGGDSSVVGVGTARIEGNVADLSSGGACAYFSGASFSGVEIRENHADVAVGGLEVWGASLTDVVIAGNTAGLSTGALQAIETVLLERVTVEGNEADFVGGIEVFGTGTVVTVIDSEVTGNVALISDAGGAQVAGNAVLDSVNTEWSANLQFDVDVVGGNAYTWGGVADFTCSGATGLCQ